jgi:hypothetical protein
MLFLLFIVTLFPTYSFAEMTKIVIEKREPFAGGYEFGVTGAYEKIVGKAYGEIAPEKHHNKSIVNLRKAPLNDRGRGLLDGCLYSQARRHEARQSDHFLRRRKSRQSSLAHELWRRAQQQSDDAGPRRRRFHDASRLFAGREWLAGRCSTRWRPSDDKLPDWKKSRRDPHPSLDHHGICFSESKLLGTD